MADDLEQREKINKVLGEGLNRRIHLTVLSLLVLSGIALQGAAWWYKIQAFNEEWGMKGILVSACIFGVCVLMVGLLLVRLWKRLRGHERRSDF